MALTKLDVLGGLEFLKVCTGYELDGNTIEYPPELSDDIARCKPVYREIPGWEEDISGVENIRGLPENARQYIILLEQLLEVKIEYISVGPGRMQTFMK
jgi:adenylosuccinate synthase